MNTSITQSFIKRLQNKKWKILTIDDLKSIWKEILIENFSDKKIYKILYNLKNKWYIISVKKDLFYIKSPQDNLELENIEEEIYWPILKYHIKKYLSTNFWYIGGKKALEIHHYDFSIPEYIYISNDTKNAKEVLIKERFIYFKKYSNLSNKLKSTIRKNIDKEKVGNITFPISNLELSILESLYSPPEEEKKQIYDLVKKTLRKKKKLINWNIIEDFIKLWKFHSSINRLYTISHFDLSIRNTVKNIIKKHSEFLSID